MARRPALNTRLPFATYLIAVAGFAAAVSGLSSCADSRCMNGHSQAQSLPAAGIHRLSVVAGAGSLIIRGGGDGVRISAVVCGPTSDAAKATGFQTAVTGDSIVLSTTYPLTRDGSNTTMDLTIRVPASMNVDVTSRSGGITISGINGAVVEALSGTLTISSIAADVTITRDGDGDLSIADVGGTAAIQQDAGGALSIKNIRGNVVIQQSSAAATSVDRVTGDVVIWGDGPGDIAVHNVGGELFIQADSGGSLVYDGISGSVVLPDDLAKLQHYGSSPGR